MAKGDTKTNQYLDIAANGTRADLPSDTCCETRSQTLIREVAERIMDVEDEVEEIKNNPDVVDIVATYADLQAYDTQHLTDKDIIRVLQDETHDGESTYYRYNKQSNTWTYVGESKQYADFVGTDGTTAGVAGLVPAPATTDTDKYLKSDGTWAEVQGGGGGTSNFNQLTNRPSYDNTTMTGSTNIPKVPTATSELTNDSGFITSSALPTVNDATLTITQNGTSKGTFTANDADDTTIALTDTTYSNFTGTDGTAAGAAGLVPAPATTDAGKFLKADGTWDTAGGSGPTVVQTTGTSTTDVMSQNATTSMVFADPAYRKKVTIGDNAQVDTNGGVAIGSGAASRGQAVIIGTNSSSAYGKTSGVGVGANTSLGGGFDVALGQSAKTTAAGAIALGSFSDASMVGEMNIGSTSTSHGYNNSNYRLLTGVYDGQSTHDAATKGQLDSIAIKNAGAPTTATVGTVGQLLEDTTNGKLYQCTAVDTTDPQNPSYTWTEVGAGGSGPTVVQTTGTSTTDVMSQNAVTSMVFADPATQNKIKIGAGTSSNVEVNAVEIGHNAAANGVSSTSVGDTSSASSIQASSFGYNAVSSGRGSLACGAGSRVNYDYGVAIGSPAKADASYSVALGSGSNATVAGQMDIGEQYGHGYNSSNYRLLTGVYDPQSAHDAATKGYVDTAVAGAAYDPTISNNTLYL